MKGKRKRDFRKQKAAKSKPRGALGGRHWQQDIAGDSFTLCAKFVVVNARPPHRSADRPRHTRSHVRSRARKAQSAGSLRRLPGPPALRAPAPGPDASPRSLKSRI